ncbi:putative proline-rich protein [Mycena venus]|uniref:Putative proline-rich protein n=1 Tax=Mycena venus TaxID=2733690 RepID=A0A8H6YPU7_9AGAR|nr:putative proline-rich protein [Mycena venus]
MWTLTAVFDGPTLDVHPPETTKLLKTDKAYPLGRKDVPLCINVKKVSRTHGTFTVAKFTEESVVDPDTRPKLEYTNTSKNLSIQRGDEIHVVNPDQSFELLDGDLVAVTSAVIMKVQWQPVCCYQQVARGKSKSLLKSCASLGIHLVHMPGQNITHHLTDSFTATTLQALSLVSATAFVKPEWLDEIAKYRPKFDDALPAEQRTLKIWEANEERMTIFSGYRFICIGEVKRQIDSELRELLTRANGRIEVFDIKGGAEKWRGTLVRSKAKAKQSLVPISDEDACTAAVGKDSWQEIVEITRVFGLRFYSNQDVIQAVLNADASLLSSSGTPDDAAPLSSPLPNVVPNTHPDEGSLVPEPEEPEPESEVPPPRKLTRRVSSRQASQEPKLAEEAPAPRRHLTRRAQPGGLPIITGLDDPSILLNNLPDTSSVAKPAAPVDPSKPRSRLKRRVGTSAPGDNVETLISNAIMSGVEPETGEEPPLKKFKALFDASDPRRSGAESFVQESGAFDDDELMLMSNIGSQSQTQDQTQTQERGKRSTRSGNSAALRALPEEEEEESQMPVDSALAADAGKKRKERSFDRDDVEMAGVEETLKSASGSSSGNGPAAKKRAVEGNAVERTAATQLANAAAKALPSTKSTGKKDAAAAGAAAGKPDTDDAFLKAIASTKRGKKTEDDFDRDFNKLKISKSNLRGGGDGSSARVGATGELWR